VSSHERELLQKPEADPWVSLWLLPHHVISSCKFLPHCHQPWGPSQILDNSVWTFSFQKCELHKPFFPHK
jgi:TFIIF-interacting CTD phosphatase-like protein